MAGNEALDAITTALGHLLLAAPHRERQRLAAAIERFAEAQGHPTITEAVMDEARGALGM